MLDKLSNVQIILCVVVILAILFVLFRCSLGCGGFNENFIDQIYYNHVSTPLFADRNLPCPGGPRSGCIGAPGSSYTTFLNCSERLDDRGKSMPLNYEPNFNYPIQDIMEGNTEATLMAPSSDSFAVALPHDVGLYD